jgi:pimeloyl-ACP methyl ester carboxylesterase
MIDPASAIRQRSHAQDLRGASRLVIEATRGVTDLVEDMHTAIVRGPADLAGTATAPVQLVTRTVYASVRGVTQLVGGAIDLALAPLVRVLGASVPSAERDAALAALNGVLGDYLRDTGNPLAVEMELCHAGVPLGLSTRAALEISEPTGKLAILIHGLGMSDRQWRRGGHDHGAALARDLGYTPIYVRYNSGLHISSNGRELAENLERLVAAWPVSVEELAVIGYSMGGLVARAACDAGETAGHAWRARAGALITLGAPHHGAPLERRGQGLDMLLGISRYSAPLRRLGRIRSAGITDLRFGNVLDAHWQGFDRHTEHEDRRSPLPLPDDVPCYAIAGSLTRGAARELGGDGLVPVASALGVHDRPELTLSFPDAHRWIARGVGHLQLLDAPEVYEAMRAWLAGARPAAAQ